MSLLDMKRMLKWAEEAKKSKLALALQIMIAREEGGEEEDAEPLDLLPEPVAFIDDYEQIRLQTFESIANACRRREYEIRKFGTRLDRW